MKWIAGALLLAALALPGLLAAAPEPPLPLRVPTPTTAPLALSQPAPPVVQWVSATHISISWDLPETGLLCLSFDRGATNVFLGCGAVDAGPGGQRWPPPGSVDAAYRPRVGDRVCLSSPGAWDVCSAPLGPLPLFERRYLPSVQR